MSAETSVSPHDLHFDLSHMGAARLDDGYTLHAGKDRYPLQRHTPETLSAGGYAPGQAGAPSHVVRGVALDRTKVRLLLIYGLVSPHQPPSLASIAVWTPSQTQVFGVQDMAKALVFLNPTVSVLTPQHGDTVLGHIGNTDQLPGLTAAISAAGPNWCTATPMSAPPYYSYELNAGVLNSTGPVSGQSKAAIYSDVSLLGTRWTLKPGRSFIDMNAPAAPRRATTSSDYNIELQDGGPNFGVSVTVNGFSDEGVLDLTVTNSYVRHCSVFVSFLDINGNPIVAESRTIRWSEGPPRARCGSLLEDYFQIARNSAGQEFLTIMSESTNTLKWCGLVSSESTFMGIPVSSTDVDFTFQLPGFGSGTSSVSKIRLLVGSMGVNSGIDWDPQAAWLGLALTGFLDLALPTYALVSGVGEQSNTIFDSIFTDKGFLLSTAFSVFTIAKDLFTGSSNFSNDMEGALYSLADSLVSKVLTSTEVATRLGGWFGAEEAVPRRCRSPDGAMKVLSLEGDGRAGSPSRSARSSARRAWSSST